MGTVINTQFISQNLSAHQLFNSAHEVEEIREKVGQVFRPHDLRVLGSHQTPSACMHHLPLRDVTINRLKYSAPVSIASEPLKDFVLVMTPLSGSATVRCGGSEVYSTAKTAAIVGINDELAMQWDQNCDQLILRIEQKAIQKTCEAFLGRPLDRSLRFSVGMDLTTEYAKLWEQVIALILTNPTVAKAASEFPLVTAQVEQMLISALLNCQPHQYRTALLETSTTITPGFVKKAEEYMSSNVADAITMQDVANHVGTSLRSLYSGFQRYRNTSPKAFLRAKRLELVRQDLLESRISGKHDTVTGIAMARGFVHLGHFTKAYQEKFGELPSETLKNCF